MREKLCEPDGDREKQNNVLEAIKEVVFLSHKGMMQKKMAESESTDAPTSANSQGTSQDILRRLHFVT